VKVTSGTGTSSPDEVVTRLRAAGCVFAEDEAALLLAQPWSAAELEASVQRRVAGEPLEVIVGWAGFCGLRIAVHPGVFVPRQRTRLLVEEASRLLRPKAVVLDLCCGTGAVGAVLASRVPGLELYATDSDAAAVRCARANLAGAGQVFEGDLFAPLPRELQGRVTVLTCNAPYVPSAAIALMPPEARLHEPRAALDGGPDGLDVQRRIAAEALSWLAPGGYLLVEAGERQAEESRSIFAAHGLAARVVSSAELDATVVVATHQG
jgi:release factor glutamine methyltransferase